MAEKDYALKQIVEMSGAIDALANSGLKVEVKASISLARNQQKLKPYVEGFTLATKYPKDMENYNKERGTVFNEYAIKSHSGGILLSNGSPIFKDLEKASAVLEGIDKKYVALLKEKEEIDKKVEASLKETHKLDLEEVKESSFSGSSETAVAIMMALMPITSR